MNIAFAATVPRWRHAAVVLGAAIGLCFSLTAVFGSALPFFLLPLSQEFGWGRGDTAAATVLGMLGVTVASPFVGRLFDRYGTERVIAASVVAFAAALSCMAVLPGKLVALGALCFVIGVAGSGTSMVGYAGVLPQWFDKRLGLALGLAGLGGAVGVGLSPFAATTLIGAFGWRQAFVALAGLGLAGGLLAFALLRRRRGEAPPMAARAAASTTARAADAPGLTLAEARRDRRFWLLLVLTFVLPFGILGVALHGAALFLDRGMTAQQGATGAAIAGLGAVLARVGVGVALDRWPATVVGAIVITAAACGLGLNSWAASFPLLCLGVFLGGAAMGAEGDLLPFMIRRYFGLRAFGSLFGTLYAAYALGGVLGPIAYGYTFDQLRSYSPIMLACAAACLLGAVGMFGMGRYRFDAMETTH